MEQSVPGLLRIEEKFVEDGGVVLARERVFRNRETGRVFDIILQWLGDNSARDVEIVSPYAVDAVVGTQLAGRGWGLSLDNKMRISVERQSEDVLVHIAVLVAPALKTLNFDPMWMHAGGDWEKAVEDLFTAIEIGILRPGIPTYKLGARPLKAERLFNIGFPVTLVGGDHRPAHASLALY